jgi:hypothetical protein
MALKFKITHNLALRDDCGEVKAVTDWASYCSLLKDMNLRMLLMTIKLACFSKCCAVNYALKGEKVKMKHTHTKHQCMLINE